MDDIIYLPFISPKYLKEQLKVTQHSKENLKKNIVAIQAILQGNDNRPLLIISIKVNSSTSAEDIYIEFDRKKQLYPKESCFIMLIDIKKFFGETQLNLFSNNSETYEDRLYKIRLWLIKFNEMGIACGIETINTFLYHYIQDLISWTFIEKTNIESQIHRIFCSAMCCPVGYECLTASDVEIANNAIKTMSNSHDFITINEQGNSIIMRSKGNNSAHIIMNNEEKLRCLNNPNNKFDFKFIGRLISENKEKHFLTCLYTIF